MIGVTAIIVNSVNVVSRIRRIAGTVRNARNDFNAAGGGVRGVVAGVKAVASAVFPETVNTAKAEIEQIKNTTIQGLNSVIAELRLELGKLKTSGQSTETVEKQLAAAIQCRENVCTTAIEAVCDIDICQAECEADEEFTALCHIYSDFMPVDKPVVPFLRQGIQEGFKHKALRAAGCYFFSLYRWAEHVLGKPLGEENVVWFFNECVKNGSMRDTAFINDPVAVLNTLCGERRFTRVAVHTNEPEARYSGLTGVFVRRVKNGNFGVHFVLDINGYTWDSLGSNAHNYRPAGLRQIV